MTKKIKLTAREIAALHTKEDGEDKSFLEYYPLVNGVITLNEKEPGKIAYLCLECSRLKLRRLRRIVDDFKASIRAKEEKIKNRKLEKENKKLDRELRHDLQHIPYAEYKKLSKMEKIVVWWMALSLGVIPKFIK